MGKVMDCRAATRNYLAKEIFCSSKINIECKKSLRFMVKTFFPGPTLNFGQKFFHINKVLENQDSDNVTKFGQIVLFGFFLLVRLCTRCVIKVLGLCFLCKLWLSYKTMLSGR